jgi:rsbT co-antagonist protein RsbR
MLMPLIGSLDTSRLTTLQEEALAAIERSRARALIVDVTAVPLIDTQVAQGLIRVTQSAKLLGAKVILVGIRPEVAQALVGLGVELHDIATRSTLEDGIAHALHQ